MAAPVASRRSQVCFCASDPKAAIGSATSDALTLAMTETTALAWASASSARA